MLHREDEDVSEALHRLFDDEGIEVVLNTRIERVLGRSGQSVEVAIEQNGTKKTLSGTHLLVATGRVPNTANLGLELAGVKLTDRGYVKVNAPRPQLPEDDVLPTRLSGEKDPISNPRF